MADWKAFSKTATAYGAALVLAVLAVNTLRAGLWKGTIPLMLAAAICLPQGQAWIARKLRLNLTLGAAVGIAVIVAALGLGVSMEQAKTQAQQKELADQAAMEKRVAAVRNAAEVEFAQNKAAILDEARGLLSIGRIKQAQAYLAKYHRVGDLDLIRVRDTVTLAALRDELPNTADPDRRAEILVEIGRLDPSDTAAAKEGAEHMAKVAERKRKEAAIAAAKVKYAKFLSKYDGSHSAVTEQIKAQLKNPHSYEHVRTEIVGADESSALVVTQYRARNSFNALVPGTATAIVSPDGYVQSLKISN